MPAHRRRGWHRAALAALALKAAIWWAVAAILMDANFKFRWVVTWSGPSLAQQWFSHAFDPNAWWQGPVAMLIVNPGCLVLIVRCITGRTMATGAAPRAAQNSLRSG